MNTGKLCLICKHFDRVSKGNHPGILYKGRQSHTVNLCYIHALDLFKTGQTNFLLKYEEAFERENLWSEPGLGEYRDNYFSFTSFK